MHIRKETLVVILSPLVIAGCLLSLFWPEGVPAASVKPHQAVGRILAEDIAERLGPGSRLVVFTARIAEDDPVAIQADTFLARCRRLDLDVVYERELAAFEQGRDDPQKELPADVYLDMLARYPDVDAFVSFVGFPRLTRRHAADVPRSRPRMYAVSRSANELRDMLNAGIIEYAIIPRFAFPAPDSIDGDAYHAWFDRYFQQVETEEELPLGPREMPRSPNRPRAAGNPHITGKGVVS